MKGKVNTGTGLIPFITSVVQQREVDQEIIDYAIKEADQEMYDNGIVAVGDICNQMDTSEVKAESPINYYSFVEMFDFLQDENAQSTFDQYKTVYEQMDVSGSNKKSAVPHAPYSVSKKLFSLINNLNSASSTVSIHNQELDAENELFTNKKGQFIDFYKGFNISLDQFNPTGRGSIHYALDQMDHAQKCLFVHNTKTTSDDIKAALIKNPNTYWATCANANLYIENNLPDYQAFLDQAAVMTIGTDSLTSNWQLSVLEEIKAIKKYKSYLPIAELLRWATLNGAKALAYENDLGSFEVGKSPGIVQLFSTRDFDINDPKEWEVRRVK